MTTNAEFTKAYLNAMHWNTPIVSDDNLSFHYPACVYTFDECRVIALCGEMSEAMEDIPSNADLPTVLSILFELESASVTYETVYGFFAQLPQIGENLAPIADEWALTELMDAMDEGDRQRGEVTMQDDFTCCIMENGRMLAAAGALAEDGLADLSVMVHPAARGRGLGARVTAALIRKVQEAGLIALYRVEKNNLPSVRLAKHLGLRRGFVMEGALVEFPDNA